MSNVTAVPTSLSSTPHRVVLEMVGPQEAKGFIVPTPAPGIPAFEGRWDTDYACARCGQLICKSVKPGLFAEIFFRCSGCNALNRVPGAPARLSAFT